MRLGNGRFESTQFNSRLQPTQIALGTSAFNTSLLKLEYDYGSTDNNGNVKSQTITVPGMSYPLIQTYAYDSLNRLQSAEEKSNNISQWKQTFTFDRYGNRSFDSANTTTFPTGCPTTVCNPSFDQSNNRFSANQGYEYDSSGNLTKDATDKRFIYDAENKQTSFGTNGSSTNGGSYFYDGDGRRVKKIVGTETTIFVYNASGQMVAEYATTAPTNPQISYLTTDTLGSPRINTDANGQVTARHDYLPFGEEIIGLGNRTTQQGYSVPDGVRQQFTGQQRDNESGLDYFGARYYDSTLGRFTSSDPLGFWMLEKKKRSEFSTNPQRWNKYVYVLNNPFRYTDPNGLAEVPIWDKLSKELQNDLAKRLGKDAQKTWDNMSSDQRQRILNARAFLIASNLWDSVSSIGLAVFEKDEKGNLKSYRIDNKSGWEVAFTTTIPHDTLKYLLKLAGYEEQNTNHPEAQWQLKESAGVSGTFFTVIIAHFLGVKSPNDKYIDIHFDKSDIISHATDWYNNSGPSSDDITKALGKNPDAAKHLKGISDSMDKLLNQK
jgi:RHS repeat-associated protein